MRIRRFAAALVAAAAPLAAAVASAGTPAPLPITSASLQQDGRQLEWRVELGRRPSIAELTGQPLCLSLASARTRAALGSLCVEAAPHGLGLTYEPAAGSRLQTVAATVTRAGRDGIVATFPPTGFDAGYRSLRWQVIGAASAFPGTPSLARLHVPRLVGCVAGGSTPVYGGSTARREIALTFDDGPWFQPPATEFVDVLARYHVPGTFFEVGEHIGPYDPTGSIERKMLADGDMIGDHSWSHPDMVGMSPAAQRSQLQMTAAAIRRATGFTPCVWRPPYGAISRQLGSLAFSLGFETVNWDIDPRDWATPGVAAIVGNVLANARPGAIVIMHFGGGPRYQTIAALPQIITALRARGYRFVTVTELLGLRLLYR